MPQLEFQAVERSFPMKRSLTDLLARRPAAELQAIRGVDLVVSPGEVLGIVGESGCGKSTLARLGVGLQPCSAGRVLLDGQPLTGPDPSGRVQMVFQDPYSSLDPRMTLGAQLDEVVAHYHPALSRTDRRAAVAQALDEVGLPLETAEKYPNALSGGQRQRVSIARALCAQPEILVADEPVSALDASVQAQIINLLRRLNRDKGLTILFISHDMNVVRYLCDQVAVMYLGEIVELQRSEKLFAAPLHPYTRALIAAVPDLLRRSEESAPIHGEIPDPFEVRRGCRFASRCPRADTACNQPQTLQRLATGAHVRCHKATAGQPQR